MRDTCRRSRWRITGRFCIVHTLGPGRQGDADYLDACRAKRNHVEYDYVDGASAAEAEELLAFAKDLREEVVGRLAAKYPGLAR